MRAWRSASSKAMPRVAHASCVVGCERANATRRAQHTRSTRTQHNTHTLQRATQHTRSTRTTHAQHNVTQHAHHAQPLLARRAVPCRAVPCPCPCRASPQVCLPVQHGKPRPRPPHRRDRQRAVKCTVHGGFLCRRQAHLRVRCPSTGVRRIVRANGQTNPK